MNKKFIIPLTFALAAVVFGLFIFRSPKYARGELDSFAGCLAEKGAVMYGAAWCPHCQNEKKAFGSSFKFIPYVECPDEPQKRLAVGIKGYPTWIFSDGRKFEGEQGLNKLSEISGCPLVAPTK